MTKVQEKIYKWLLNKPGYLKKGISSIKMNCPFGSDVNKDYEIALKQARIDSKTLKSESNDVVTEYLKPVLKPKKIQRQLDPNNVIFLPDLHAPFIKEGVLEFCKEQQLKYNCGQVILAGDILDGHAWSYHEHDPDGLSVGDELSA